MNETQNRAKRGPAVAQPAFRPKLAFYHANSRGTGGAVSMDLHPAHGNKDGCIMMRIANQMTIGNRQGPNPTFPRFDWENAIVVKLGFDDLCQILQVFRGECESVGDGKGLIHVTAKASTSIRLRHMIEPVKGYSLEVYRTSRNGGEESRAHILFSNAEAVGLCEAIAGSMSVISFGIPVVLPHDTAAYEAEQKEFRNATAA